MLLKVERRFTSPNSTEYYHGLDLNYQQLAKHQLRIWVN
jgi:hypothetical protein